MKTDENNMMEIYKSETDNILLQHPELNTIINNTLSPDSYPFKLTSYLSTAKNMYGRDMTDEDFAYCSIIGWGTLKTLEKQQPDIYKVTIEKLKPFLIKWYNQHTENKKSIIDDFLMKVSFWTVYFNSESLANGERIASLPLTGGKIISPDSKVGFGEIVILQSLLWIETYKVEYDVSGTNWYDGNILNSFGFTREIYKTLRQLKGNYLLSDVNGWDVRSLFCAIGTGCQYFSTIMNVNIIKYLYNASKIYNPNSMTLYFGDLITVVSEYFGQTIGVHDAVDFAKLLGRMFLPTLYGVGEDADDKFEAQYDKWHYIRYLLLRGESTLKQLVYFV